jgi:hypothetical protein
MADTISDVTTVAPGDSISQAGPKAPPPAPRPSRAAGKRSSKNAPSKDTPPGAVQVGKPGQAKTGKTTPPVTATIPLTGWSDLDVTATRVETIPTFTVDVNPYLDLVRTEFDRIASRSPSGGKHIPFALFQYFCLELWWFRVLTLLKLNGQVLTTDQKNFLNAVSAAEEFAVPAHVAQYLANLGNFLQGGEVFHIRLLAISFTGIADGNVVREGWVDCGNATTRVTTSQQFWAYAQLPVPGVYVTSVTNEIAENDPSNPGVNDIDHVTPLAPEGRSWLDTPNIAGWQTEFMRYNHNSHRSAYANLGWSDAAIPTDMQTCFLYSASSMRWMSDKLSTIKEIKLHGSKQLTLSAQGSPLQAYWLEEPDKAFSYDLRDYAGTLAREKASAVTELSLVSRFSVDPKALTPAFAFGYRLGRTKVVTGFKGRDPIYAERSNFQPWILQDTTGAAPVIVDPPAGFLAAMNATWSYGSGVHLNLVRFATPTMRRDLALQSSLLLVE